MGQESTIGTNIKALMDKKGLNSIDLSKLLGNKTSATIRHWCNSSAYPRSNELDNIADTLGVKVIDILPNSKENRREIVKEELKNHLENYVDLIPSITIPSSIKHVRVVKGYPTTSTNNIVQEDSMHYVTKIYIDKRMVKTAYQDKELEAAVMIGDSMSPYLENDDIAIYHPTSSPLGDGRYVINTPCGLTVKKLKFMSSGSVLLISENSTYNTHGTYDEEFTADIVDTLEIYGLVVGRILKS